jgi:acetyltransferase EpsM
MICAQDAGEPVKPIGYLDDNQGACTSTRLALPILGVISDLAYIAHDGLVVAIGDNHTRQAMFDYLQDRGEHFVTARHPAAVIASDVPVGPGAVICAGVVVNPGAVIGAGVILNTGCSVDHDNRVGDHAHVAPGAHLGGDVAVGTGALVGIGATVMPGRRVGDWAIVGAGALVTKDVPAHATVLGVPARVVGAVEQPWTQSSISENRIG